MGGNCILKNYRYFARKKNRPITKKNVSRDNIKGVETAERPNDELFNF